LKPFLFLIPKLVYNMDILKVVFISVIMLLVISCNTKKKPSIYFSSKFPDHNRNLTHALPDTFKVRYNTSDTSQFTVCYNDLSGLNYIIDVNKKDTLFSGYVGKYKGLYFLSRIVSDNHYLIHALHTDGYTIKGLHTEPLQIKLVESELKNTFKELIQSESDSVIMLTPIKKVLFPYFKHLLTKLRGDTIIDYNLHMERRRSSH
jgi:hypothetical protein